MPLLVALSLLTLSLAKPWDPELPIDLSKEDCRYAVSGRDGTGNEVCRDLCSANDTSQFEIQDDGLRTCTFQYYEINYLTQTVDDLDPCFNQRVYGIGPETPDAEGDTVTVAMKEEDGPATLCQSLCQAFHWCSNWVFMALPNKTDSRVNYQTNSCQLKYYRSAYTVSHMNLDNYDIPVDTKYCPRDLVDGCRDGSMPCIECNDTLRCIWTDRRFVSGPRYCDPKPEYCDIRTTTTTTTFPTTIPPHKPNVFPLAAGAAGGTVAAGMIANYLTRGRPHASYQPNIHDGVEADRQEVDLEQRQDITPELYM